MHSHRRWRTASETSGMAAIHERQPLLAAALPWVGHAQTRSRGTFCGSVAHADPSAEIPLVLLALKGAIHFCRHGKSSGAFLPLISLPGYVDGAQ